MQKFTVRTTKPKMPPVRIVDAVNRIRTGFLKLNKNMVPPSVALLEMICGQWISQAIFAVAELGVADHVTDAGVSSDVLAEKVGAHPDALYRTLRALTAVDVFFELPNKVFKLTAIGKCLRTDHPQSVRYLSIYQGHTNWANWGEILHCLKTGTNAVEKVRGMPPFEFFTKNKNHADIFDKAMVNLSENEIDSILAVYDFSKFGVIADIGGGYGAFLASILMTNPKARGMLYDMPHVVEGARENFAKAGLLERVTVKGGSFFDSIPEGAEVYMMKHIIHDWSDEESIKILKNIRAKIPGSGKLLLFEAIVPERNVPHFSKFLDLEMLVVTTGRERTRDEFDQLLAKAGFKLNRVVPTVSIAHVIEAVPN